MISPKIQYKKWISAEDMHQESKSWLSELKFVKDEQHFFEDLITEYTRQLIESRKFANNKELIDTLSRSEKRINEIIKTIEDHENELEILVDGIDQLKEEEAYRNKHEELVTTISDYLDEYKVLKTQLFDTIKTIMKTDKQERLLDRE